MRNEQYLGYCVCIGVYTYSVSSEYTELKTEEGYSADIVRTYIPGDIFPHNLGTMCGHCTMSAQHLTKDICRHNVRTMSAQCPHYILLRFSAQIIYWKLQRKLIKPVLIKGSCNIFQTLCICTYMYSYWWNTVESLLCIFQQRWERICVFRKKCTGEHFNAFESSNISLWL